MEGRLTVTSPLVEESPVFATPGLEAVRNRVESYQPLYGITGFEDPIPSHLSTATWPMYLITR